MPANSKMRQSPDMDHDILLELTASELAELLEIINERGTCPDCLAELLSMMAEGMRQEWPDSR